MTVFFPAASSDAVAHRRIGIRVVVGMILRLVREIVPGIVLEVVREIGILALRVGFLADFRLDLREIGVLDLRRDVFRDVERGVIADPECAVGPGLRGLGGSGRDGIASIKW